MTDRLQHSIFYPALLHLQRTGDDCRPGQDEKERQEDIHGDSLLLPVRSACSCRWHRRMPHWGLSRYCVEWC